MQNKSLTERVAILCAPVFLFGLYGLIVTGLFWPGILILAWLISIPLLLAESGWLGVWIIVQSTLWLAGLGFLLVVGPGIWPGVLLVAGLSALIMAVAPVDKVDRNKYSWPFNFKAPAREKAKRSMPLPARWDDTDEEPDDALYDAPAASNNHRHHSGY